jgi:hypothetical protein
LVENFAIRDFGHASRVCEISGKRAVGPGLGTVPFAMIAMALGAFLPVKLPGRIQIGFRRKERVLKTLEFLGDDPRFVLLVDKVDDREANEGEGGRKKDFSQFEIA